MTIRQIATILDAKVLCGEEFLDTPVVSAYSSDMMSDVLAWAKDQSVLLTGLINPQAIRTALMLDMKCVCFVRGKMPDEKILSVAEENGIVVLATEEGMFTSCGKLYNAGIGGDH